MAARNDFDRHLHDDPPLPVYALLSEEVMLLREAVDALRRRVLTRAADFNRDELRAGEVPIERALEAARTLPMMAERRWVLVSQVDKLKAADQGPLLEYLERPVATTVLVLAGTKLDQRTKLGSKLAAQKAVFALQVPRQNELAAWVTRRAKTRGRATIESDAAQLLADLIGAELGSLDMALEKLAVYAGPGAAITAEDVEAIVAPTRVHSIFSLTDAIGSRDLASASRLLRNALSGGESALMVLGMIARQFRQLAQIKELQRAGAGQASIVQQLGVRPFLVADLSAQARRYRARELIGALEAVRRADQRLKSSRLDPGVILDRLLVEVMEPRSAA